MFPSPRGWKSAVRFVLPLCSLCGMYCHSTVWQKLIAQATELGVLGLLIHVHACTGPKDICKNIWVYLTRSIGSWVADLSLKLCIWVNINFVKFIQYIHQDNNSWESIKCLVHYCHLPLYPCLSLKNESFFWCFINLTIDGVQWEIYLTCGDSFTNWIRAPHLAKPCLTCQIFP